MDITSMTTNETRVEQDWMLAGWQTFVERVISANTQESVLAALQDFLAACGYPPPRCRVFEGPLAEGPPGDMVWRFPVGRSHWLVLEFPSVVPQPTGEQPIYMALTLARIRIERLLDEIRCWGLFTEALDRISTASTESGVFQELADGLARLFDLSHVRILRYRPDVDGFSVEASVDRGGEFPLTSDRVIPLPDVPAHAQALDHGQAVHLDVSLGHAEVIAERDVLFPAEVERAAIVPFWMSTRDLGVVSVAGWNDESPEYSPLFQALLHHTAVAVERVRLFEDVEMARREADLILEKTFSGVMLLSSDLNVIRANPAAASLWGLRVEDILGRSAAELFGPKVENLFPARRNGHELRPPGAPREWRITTVTGEPRDVLVGISPLPTHEHNGSGGYLVTLVDVSQQRRLERLKQYMITNVTHEMRTPIAVIRGYVELLQNIGDEADPALRAQALTVIQQRANDLLRMVDMYIDLSRLEAGEVELQPRVVDVRETVRMLWGEMTVYAERTPTLQVSVADEARRVKVDSHLFGQILRHLLDNALKFTPADGKITVRAWAEGRDLHLEVSDTGTGIPAQDLPHVFAPFYRGENAGFGVAGSGMGLALVRAATRYMGGHVEVVSQQGQGSTFHITLPRVIHNIQRTSR